MGTARSYGNGGETLATAAIARINERAANAHATPATSEPARREKTNDELWPTSRARAATTTTTRGEPMPAPVQWPPERVIAALQAFHAKHERAPKRSDCDIQKDGLPTWSPIVRCFGSLSAALAAAGITTSPPTAAASPPATADEPEPASEPGPAIEPDIVELAKAIHRGCNPEGLITWGEADEHVRETCTMAAFAAVTHLRAAGRLREQEPELIIVDEEQAATTAADEPRSYSVELVQSSVNQAALSASLPSPTLTLAYARSRRERFLDALIDDLERWEGDGGAGDYGWSERCDRIERQLDALQKERA